MSKVPKVWTEDVVFSPTAEEWIAIRKWMHNHKCALKIQDLNGFNKFKVVFGKGNVLGTCAVACDCGDREYVTDFSLF